MAVSLKGLPPVADARSSRLVLGSMPGQVSLSAGEYYAHPRNSFWAIMAALFGGEAGAAYGARKKLLLENRVALWDVIGSCRRKGSLDTAIEPRSVQVNDFASFFREHPHVHRVYFNGLRAEQEFRRHVMKPLAGQLAGLNLVRLPSTSPAMASLGFAQKLEAWSLLKNG